ncbi:hypothetical protein [Cupriavidus sp. D39]|uniref:hypothetical protein n=1 Tax=Cupriavidus sp. D39 TaxID=2997877 RepID=UPI00226FB8E4|nr:hypothetical protein [Cupriavidus sp. D39]MCY0852625.1 hypothetical protein [Cupriavidus sp. D39]
MSTDTSVDKLEFSRATYYFFCSCSEGHRGHRAVPWPLLLMPSLSIEHLDQKSAVLAGYTRVTLKVCPGSSNGICTAEAIKANTDLLSFLQQ